MSDGPTIPGGPSDPPAGFATAAVGPDRGTRGGDRRGPGRAARRSRRSDKPETRTADRSWSSYAWDQIKDNPRPATGR
jgi:hypothetical protein